MGASCSADSPMFKQPDAFIYDESQGQVAQMNSNLVQKEPYPLDTARCTPKETSKRKSSGEYDMRVLRRKLEAKIDENERKIKGLSKDAHSRKQRAEDDELPEEMPTELLKTSSLDEAVDARDEDVSKDAPKEVHDTADKGCTFWSIFPCCSSTHEEPSVPTSPGKAASAQPQQTSGWGGLSALSGAMGGSTSTESPTFAQAPYGYGRNGVDKLSAVAAKRMADGLDVRHEADVFINALKMSVDEVADALRQQGASPEVVKKMIAKGIDGDTLRYMQVEDIMRELDLKLYRARGLYTKFWRILGIKIVGEVLRIEAVDSKPTGESLVKMVQKLKASGMSLSISLSDEGKRYMDSVQKPEKMEMKEEETAGASEEVSTERRITPEGQESPMQLEADTPEGKPTPAQQTIVSNEQDMQKQLQKETAGKDGAMS